MKERGKTVALLLAVFVLGAVAGIGGSRAISHHRHRGPEHRQERMLRGLTRKLDLDSAQRDKVKKILESNADARNQARASCEPAVKAVRERVRGEISAVLTDEQRTKFEEMKRRHDAKK